MTDYFYGLKNGFFDHLDLGCSNGRSINFAQEKLGARNSLGIDISPAKVRAAKEQGIAALIYDATELDLMTDSVSLVTMSHFLEHLPGFDLARKCVVSARAAARDFVVFRQPWFDSDGYLARNGLKFFWSDWKGHSFCMTTLDILRILRELEGVHWKVYGVRKVVHSRDSACLPLGAPYGQHHYDFERHGEKPLLKLEDVAYYQTLCIIDVKGERRFSKVERAFPKAETLYSSFPVSPI